MLDIYKIKDEDTVDNYPVESEYVGSFSLEEFKELDELTQYAKKNSLVFHFFSDFRLTVQQVKDMIRFWDENNGLFSSSDIKKNAYDKLRRFFQESMNSGTGIIAFCD